MRWVAGLTAGWVVLNFFKGWWRWLCASVQVAGAVTAATGGNDPAGVSDAGAAEASCSAGRADGPEACVADAVVSGLAWWLCMAQHWLLNGKRRLRHNLLYHRL
jgi:hypothetical protein